MSIQERVGDLFDARGFGALAHGCNCAGAMGAGIAVEFRRRWPQMYEEYKHRCNAGSFSPGDVFIWPVAGLVIYNFGTQRTWRTKATIEAIGTAAQLMVRDARSRGIQAIGLPRIGAGLGGLEWPRVRALLGEVATDGGVRLIVHVLGEKGTAHGREYRP
ncbi:hypothetical protein GCM10009547_11160 [Sporichthya brevicatena]|uniref:Macro domain-containing protein n=1 Tax=Sporichthya brevicatena TaxID=171442 RepID=A0ABN1GG77_9ACTN